MGVCVFDCVSVCLLDGQDVDCIFIVVKGRILLSSGEFQPFNLVVKG